MKCVKTGCDLYLRNRGVYLHGDLFVPFRGPGANGELMLGMFDAPASADEQTPLRQLIRVPLVMRVCWTGRSPLYSRLHIIAAREDHWFDEGATADSRNSTLFVSQEESHWFGYYGAPLAEAFRL